MSGVRLLPVSLLAGLATAVGTVAVHQWWWGLLLAAAATLTTLLATPPGWATRLPYAVAYVAVVGLSSVPRGAGDFLVSGTGRGYTVMALALVVLTGAISTLPRPGQTDPRQSEGKAASE